MLTDFWRDMLSLFGLGLTLVGLCYAIAQIKKTQSAAKAAEEASKKALIESIALFQRYVASNAQRFIGEANIHVENESWKEAGTRINDLADQVGQLANMDAGWKGFSDSLRQWSSTFARMASGKLKKFSGKKWVEFLKRLREKIDSSLSLFPS